jgi:hypothetical protein
MSPPQNIQFEVAWASEVNRPLANRIVRKYWDLVKGLLAGKKAYCTGWIAIGGGCMVALKVKESKRGSDARASSRLSALPNRLLISFAPPFPGTAI